MWLWCDKFPYLMFRKVVQFLLHASLFKNWSLLISLSLLFIRLCQRWLLSTDVCTEVPSSEQLRTQIYQHVYFLSKILKVLKSLLYECKSLKTKFPMCVCSTKDRLPTMFKATAERLFWAAEYWPSDIPQHAKADKCAQKDSGVSLPCKVDKQSCGQARRQRPSDQLAGQLLPSTLTTHDQKWRTIPRLLLVHACQHYWKLLLAFAHTAADRLSRQKLGSEFTNEEDHTKCIRFMEYLLHIRTFPGSLTAICAKLTTF